MQKPGAIPCTIMRGGTSKGLFFLDSDLPSDAETRTRTLLAAFGSPDPRQIDGLGGADPLTSKAAIISPSSDPTIDVNYTFGQVSVQEAFVDFAGNCGNLSSAVGPFAIDKGLVTAVEPITRVRILNTNTGKVIVAEVPVSQGQAVSAGGYRIDGVPGSGAKITLHFLKPGGVITDKLFPTGKPRDQVSLEDGRKFEVSIVDAGNPTGFVLASQLGLQGTELPEQLESQGDTLDTLEELRAKISQILGLCDSWKTAYHRYTTNPKISFVAPPADYQTITKQTVEETQIDLQARVMSMGRLHKAFALTAAIPLAAASRVSDSVPKQVCRQNGSSVRIGHPSGTLSVGVVAGAQADSVEEVTIGRTARKLMDGTVYL